MAYWKSAFQINQAFDIIYKLMGLRSRLKEIISKADVFSTTEFLRFQKEPQYQTTFGGCFSIILITILIGAFFTKVMATLTMQSISSVSSTQNADDPVPIVLTSSGVQRRGFMVGVQIWHFDLNNGPRMFDINLVNRNYNFGEETNSSKEWPLQPCTIDHWKGYPQVQAKYQSLQINYWLCLPKDNDFIIQGKYSSPVQNTIQFSVNKCSNNSIFTRECASSEQISQFFRNSSQKVFFTIYFTNPLLNPDQEEFISYYLNDQNYIIFSETGGEEGQILMDDYQIVTDNSISPLSDYTTEAGGIVSRSAIKNRFEISSDNTNYCTFFIYKSSNSINITREYDKLDNILSYIGGLFGTLTIFLFFIKIFNNHTFEINLGSYLYKYDQQKEQLHKYNFIYFILQQIYRLFRNKLNQNPLWERVKGYYDCRNELLKQLDVLYLLKRVSFLERAIETVLEDHQLKGVHLLKKQTLLQAKKYRKKFKLHEKAIEECEVFQYKRKNTQTTGKEGPKQREGLLRGNRVENEDSINCTVQQLQMKKSDNQSSSQHQPERPQAPPAPNEHSESESRSSSDQGQTFKDQNTVDLLLRLRKEKEMSTVSRRIYQNLNETLKQFIDKYDEKEQGSNNSPIQEDSYSNLLMRNVKTIDFKPKKRYRSLPKMDHSNFARLFKHENVENIADLLQSKEQFEQISFK